MPKITYVMKAQQRYQTVPVIDPETGEQKRSPVMRKDGTPKTTKSGRPITLGITARDISRPKPLFKCDHCGKEIQIGTPYKHMTPKSGPYGGRTLTRHAGCPSWQSWEYSSALWARIEQIQHDFQTAMEGALDPDAVTDALSDAAQAVRDLSEEKRESADSLEDGFGHSTYQSEELNQTADDLEGWADEIENADVPAIEDYPCSECDGEGEIDCEYCGGDGTDEEGPCTECTGGRTTCPECEGKEGYFDEEVWSEAVQDAVGIVEESPVG